MIRQVFATLKYLILILLVCLVAYASYLWIMLRPMHASQVITAEGPTDPILIPSYLPNFSQKWIMHVCSNRFSECVSDMSQLQVYKNDVGPIKIVALSYKEDKTKKSDWLDNSGNLYEQIVKDDDGSIGQEIMISDVPQTIAINESGEIEFHITGPFNQAAVESLVSSGYTK